MTLAPEERIGAAVAEHLRSERWQVFSEVTNVPGRGKARADIVAVREENCQRDVIVVECKAKFSWAAVAQLEAWNGYTHGLYLATGDHAHAGIIARALCGIGLGWYVVGETVHMAAHSCATALRGRPALLLDALRPEHQASRPGNADSAYWRDRDERDRRIRELVAARPGLELRAVLSALGLRLGAQDRRLLARRVRTALDGVTAKADGKRLLLYPSDRTL